MGIFDKSRVFVGLGIAVIAVLGCSRKSYTSRYPKTAQGKCSITSAVWDCNDPASVKASRERAVQAQEAAVASESGTSELVRVAPPSEEVSAFTYECTNGQWFVVESGEGGVTVKKDGKELWLSAQSDIDFSGDQGALKVESPSLASLELEGQAPLRSCARVETQGEAASVAP